MDFTEKVLIETAAEYGITVDELLQRKKTSHIVGARNCAIKIMDDKKIPKCQIAQVMKRNRVTILNSLGMFAFDIGDKTEHYYHYLHVTTRMKRTSLEEELERLNKGDDFNAGVMYAIDYLLHHEL